MYPLSTIIACFTQDTKDISTVVTVHVIVVILKSHHIKLTIIGDHF